MLEAQLRTVLEWCGQTKGEEIDQALDQAAPVSPPHGRRSYSPPTVQPDPTRERALAILRAATEESGLSLRGFSETVASPFDLVDRLDAKGEWVVRAGQTARAQTEALRMADMRREHKRVRGMGEAEASREAEIQQRLLIPRLLLHISLLHRQRAQLSVHGLYQP